MDVPGGQELDGVEAAEDEEDHMVDVVEDETAQQVVLLVHSVHAPLYTRATLQHS